MICDFMQTQLDYIFFFGGVGFILLGVVAWSLSRAEDRQMPWRWLCLFGLLCGIDKWLNMLAIYIGDSIAFAAVRLIITVLSFLFLIEFGRAGWQTSHGRRPGRWVFIPLLTLAGLGAFAGMPGLNAGARYVLGLTGGLWAAMALWRFRRGVPAGGRAIAIAAFCMGLYGLTTALAAAHAAFFSAPLISNESFPAFAGFPIHLLSGLLACIAAASVRRYSRAERGGAFTTPSSSTVPRRETWVAVSVAAVLAAGWIMTFAVGELGRRYDEERCRSDLDLLRTSFLDSIRVVDALVKTMAASPDLTSMALPDRADLVLMNATLDRYATVIPGSICYVLDSSGTTLASSNRDTPESFVGHSYAVRPYFKEAMAGSRGHYVAVGLTSKVPGYYASYPVGAVGGNIAGVAVVKLNLNMVLTPSSHWSYGFLVGPDGIILSSTHPDFFLKTLRPVSEEVPRRFSETKQFPIRPGSPVLPADFAMGKWFCFRGEVVQGFEQTTSVEGLSYVLLSSMKGWKMRRSISILITLLTAVFLLTFFVLQQKKNESTARIAASERLYRTLVEGSPSWIGLFDQDGRCVTVNGNGLAAMGRTEAELHGRRFPEIWARPGEPMLEDAVRRVFAGERVSFETDLVGPGGVPMTWHVVLNPICEHNGPAMSFVGIATDISGRKHAEEALKASEEQLRSLLDATPDVVCLKDGEGRWLEANKADLELFELTGVDYRGKKDSELTGFSNFYREAFLTCEQSDEAAWRARAQTRCDEAIVRPDGTTRVFDVIKVPLFHADGRRRGLVVLARDITERVGQEREIALLNRLYSVLSKVSQAVARAAPRDAFLDEACRVIVEEGRFLLAWIGQIDPASHEVVPTACRGQAADYLRGIKVYADDRPEGRGPTGASIRERRSSVYNDFLCDLPALPWRERAVQFNMRSAAAFPIVSEGEIWGALTIYSDNIGSFGDKDVKLLENVAGDIGFALDNLERQRQRLQARHALHESEKKYRNLFENAPIGIFRTNSKGQALSINSAMAAMLGASSPEQVVEHYTDLGAQLYAHAERREEFLQVLRQKGHVEEFEYEARTLDGRNKWLSMNARLESRGQDGVMIIEGFASDITERKLAEKEKQRLEAQLRQAHKMEAVGTLAGGIAHEFNNILGIILGNAEVANDDVPKNSPARSNLKEIKTASLRARDVVRQLLAFSRKGEENRQPLDLPSVVTDAIRFLRASMPSNIEIRQNIAERCYPVIADQTQIHQVILNLSTNAAHAMEETGGILEFSLRNVDLEKGDQRFAAKLPPGGYVLLEVSDSGAGIPAGIMERIFDPFFTTKEVGKGTGMGLAVVHGIVEAHGGSIQVGNNAGGGTVFKILFPATREQAEALLDLEEELPTGSERVLFIDDEPSIAKLGRLILARLGYQVQSETNPREALKIFAANPGQFDLVITDTTMPGMTGDQLIKEILRVRPEMKTILCSGYSQRVDDQSARSIGAKAYVMKPFDQKKLAETVRKVLDETT